MASKESSPNRLSPRKKLIDQGLEKWQGWNKWTLRAEGVAIAGGLVFGVPWLVALGATGAAIDGAQILAIKEVQKQREKKSGIKSKGVIFQASRK